MFDDLIEYPIVSNRLQWEARQVVRDLYQKPHLLMRIKLTGTRFPQRAEEPFMCVGELRSRFAVIAEDGQSVRAYFDESLPPEGMVDFGYGDRVLLRAARLFSSSEAEVLDIKRLPPKTRFMDRFFGRDIR